MARSWDFDGGGRAHARTLRTLGYVCLGLTTDAYVMHREGVTITVPRVPRLAPDVRRYLRVASGHSRGEYLHAWGRKVSNLGCPPVGREATEKQSRSSNPNG
jgi:hypothetical protein